MAAKTSKALLKKVKAEKTLRRASQMRETLEEEEEDDLGIREQGREGEVTQALPPPCPEQGLRWAALEGNAGGQAGGLLSLTLFLKQTFSPADQFTKTYTSTKLYIPIIRIIVSHPKK